MKISLKVTIWSVCALALSLACFILLGNLVLGRSATRNFQEFNQVLLREAVIEYEAGGASELSRFLRELNSRGDVQVHLTDARGRDLATGEDHSEIVRETVGRQRPYYSKSNRIAMGLGSEDGRYIWIVTTSTPSLILFAPFYLLLLGTVTALYWLVATQITRPLRQLALVVDRFGRGEMRVRASTQSKDEIGSLSTAFNSMADRIGTLLTAERQLLQDVSHELRSPLARLTFEAEIVRKTSNPAESATRLRREIKRLSELVGTLIEMARAEGDPGTVQIEELCLNDLIVEIADDCRIEAESRASGIEVSLHDVIHVHGNPELLRRAIENVLRNAIRYTPVDTCVEIRLEHHEDRAAILIRDYGPGIPAEFSERVFDPFFRVDSARAEESGGLGLGLAIAQRAVRVHHGTISAGNASPGAVFKIELPVDSHIVS